MRHLFTGLFVAASICASGLRAQTVTTYAGSYDFNKIDGRDTNCTFNAPHDLVRDRHGNIFVADMLNEAIRKIDPGGQVTTVVTKKTVPDFKDLAHLAVDSNGNLYYANKFGRFIGKITPSGAASVFAGTGTNGDLDTISGLATFNSVGGLLAAGNDTLYVADGNKIRMITNGRVSTFAGQSLPGNANGPRTTASFSGLSALVMDSAGNLFVADNGNHLIRKISPFGLVSTAAGSGAVSKIDDTGTKASFIRIIDMAIDRSSGNIYMVENFDDVVRRMTPGGVVTTVIASGNCRYVNGYSPAAGFCNISGIVADTGGHLYVSDASNHAIRRVRPDAYVTTHAGNPIKSRINGADRLQSSFAGPNSIAIDSNGNFYISDMFNNQIRKVTRSGVVSNFCGSGMRGNQTGSADSSAFDEPWDIVINRKTGILYVMDRANARIRTIDPSGRSTYFVGSGKPGDVHGVSGTAADISPKGFMCIDTAGNLYFTDYYNNVKKVDPAGMVTNYYHRPADNLTGIAADKKGNIYVAHRLPEQGIKKIAPGGIVSSVKGISATIPAGIACDDHGRVYLADELSASVTVYNDSGWVGGFGGASGYADGPWNQARLMQPMGLTTEESDSIYLYIADRGNNLIRRTAMSLPQIPAIVRKTKPFQAAMVLPNPSAGMFDILIPGSAINNGEVAVSDMAGRILYRKPVGITDGRCRLDLRSLHPAPGMYFITIVSANSGWVASVVIEPASIR